MRKLSKLLVVMAMILASTGTTAAGAAKPEVPPPTIDLVAPAARCVLSGSGFGLVLEIPEPVVTDGDLSNIHANVSRMADMTISSGYTKQIGQESWHFGWWEGDDAGVPTFPYVLNTTHTYGPPVPLIPSWTGHSLVGHDLTSNPPPPTATFTPNGYWEVSMGAGAVADAPRGRRGGSSVWTGQDWVLECTAAGPATLHERPQLTWCDEDADGFWAWDEAGPERIECPLDY